MKKLIKVEIKGLDEISKTLGDPEFIERLFTAPFAEGLKQIVGQAMSICDDSSLRERMNYRVSYRDEKISLTLEPAEALDFFRRAYVMAKGRISDDIKPAIEGLLSQKPGN